MPITNGNQLFLGVVGAMNQRAALGAQERQAAASNQIAQQHVQLQQQQLAQAILQMKQAKEAQDALNKYRMESLQLQQDNFRLHEEQWRATDQLRQTELHQKQLQLDMMQEQFAEAQQLPDVLAQVMSGVGGIAQAQLGGDQEQVRAAVGKFSALFERPEIAKLSDRIVPFASKAYGAFNIDTGTQNILLQSQLKAAQAGIAQAPKDIEPSNMEALTKSFDTLMQSYGAIRTRDGVFSSPEEVDRIYEDKTKKILDEFKPTSQTIAALSQMGAFRRDDIAELVAAGEQNNPHLATSAVGKIMDGLRKTMDTEVITPERRAELERVALRLNQTREEISRINRTHTATRKLVENVETDVRATMTDSFLVARSKLDANPIQTATFSTAAQLKRGLKPLQDLMAVDEVQEAFDEYVNTASPDQVAVQKLAAAVNEFAPPSLKADAETRRNLFAMLLRSHDEKPRRSADAAPSHREEEERLSIADLRAQNK